jgi:ABC-type transport system involved in cytochrome bd biosynthesis fused ATPase/permease subunit
VARTKNSGLPLPEQFSRIREFLILDDSTSSVDTETEAEIREALQNL